MATPAASTLYGFPAPGFCTAPATAENIVHFQTLLASPSNAEFHEALALANKNSSSPITPPEHITGGIVAVVSPDCGWCVRCMATINALTLLMPAYAQTTVSWMLPEQALRLTQIAPSNPISKVLATTQTIPVFLFLNSKGEVKHYKDTARDLESIVAEYMYFNSPARSYNRESFWPGFDEAVPESGRKYAHSMVG